MGSFHTVIECDQSPTPFSPVKRHKVEADFSGCDTFSNAGIPLLSQIDQKVRLARSIAKGLTDSRRKASCHLSLEELIKQPGYLVVTG